MIQHLNMIQQNEECEALRIAGEMG
jgi:hypothetical protein